MWERVEQLMNEYGVKMSELARGCGISYSTLTDWKSGRYIPKLDKIEKIADYFYVSPNYIMGKTDDRNSYGEYQSTPFYKDPMEKSISDPMEKSISDSIANISGYIYQQMIKDHPEILKHDEILSDHSVEEIEDALNLYQLYQKADPKIQAAIEALLKDQ